jgi:hypothetical protein
VGTPPRWGRESGNPVGYESGASERSPIDLSRPSSHQQSIDFAADRERAARFPREITTQTLSFEDQCLDLDTGTVHGTAEESCMDVVGDQTPWDIQIAYHADREVHGVVVLNLDGALEIAYLEGVNFDSVTADAIAGAPFVTEDSDRSFDGTVVILIRTDLGAVYKLGNPSEVDTGVTFDTEQL